MNKDSVAYGTYFISDYSFDVPSYYGNSRSVKSELTNYFSELKNHIFFDVTPTEIKMINQINKSIMLPTNDQQVFVFDQRFKIERDILGRTVLASRNGLITLYLTPTKNDTEHFKLIKQNINRNVQSLTNNIKTIQQAFHNENLITEYQGTNHNINQNITIKIPNSEQYQFSELTENFIGSIAGMDLNQPQDGSKIFSLAIKDVDTIYIAVIPKSQDSFDLDQYLHNQNLVYKEKNGAIFFHNMNLSYTAIYTYYDARNQQYILVEYQNDNIPTLSNVYSILRTISPNHNE